MKSIFMNIILIKAIILLTACVSTPVVSPDGGVGWISDDVFRVRSAGAAKYAVTDVQERKRQSLQAAMLMGRYIVFETLVAEIVPVVRHLPREEIVRLVKKEFAEFVNAGSAVDIHYDDEGLCTLLFEIRGRGIKQKFYGLRNRLMVENR